MSVAAPANTISTPLLDQSAFEAAVAAEPLSPETYRSALSEAADSLKAQHHRGVRATELVQRRADTLDRILSAYWNALPVANATLVAVGGYGRGELHPGSDVDILILLEAEVDSDPETLAPVEVFVTFLWDIGLDVGHSVRTVQECIEQARGDVTIATNLMEARLLSGDPALFQAMVEGTSAPAVWPTHEFFVAKRDEQTARHARHHGSGYNLEPNVKEGPGGLRDIQMIGWVLKRHFGAESLADLVIRGFLTEEEHQTLVDGQAFLWQVRLSLHLCAGRREDRLLFDLQREIASQFGYEDEQHNLAVEHFMRHYYRTIMELSRLNEILLGLFEERFLGTERPPEIRNINRRFQVHNGYLEVTNDDVFRRYPFALLELFLVLQQNPEIGGVRPSTIRLVRDHLFLIDESFRQDLGCRSLFLDIIRQPRGQTHEFRRMHLYGILGAYLPVFDRIVGLMQFDLFHAYTVDEHTLFMVRNLRQFMVPEHAHELPHCSAVVKNLPKPELLYLGGLFHDISKGQGGNHSELGAEAALEFCRHHGISQYDAQLVAWLVRNHLVMSTTAQREDISDPEVVFRFAERVGSTTRLDYLYLLTVADIRATNPDLWNDWKNALLMDLYQRTHRALRRGLDSPLAAADIIEECKADALADLTATGVPSETITRIWSVHSDDYFVRTRPEDVSWHTQELLSNSDTSDLVVAVRTSERGTEVFVYCDDKDYLFATTCTVLERLGLTVLDARIFTDENGMTYDSFIVLEADGSSLEEPNREREISQALNQALSAPEKSVIPTNRLPRQSLGSVALEPRVFFDHDLAKGRTDIEVIAADRPGLLSRIGWALVHSEVTLQNAKIATFGERAEDIFFVTDPEGGPLSAVRCEQVRTKILEALESENNT